MRTTSRPLPSTISLDAARDRDRERRPSLPAARADQAQEEQQRLLDGDLAALLVDEEEPLARAVEDGAEVGADRADEPLRLPDRLAQRDRRRAARSVNPCAETASTPSGPSTSGSTNDGGRVAVVDDDAEARARSIASTSSGVEQVLRVAARAPGPGSVTLPMSPNGTRRSSRRLKCFSTSFSSAGRHLDARLLEEADLDHLGVGLADADVDAGVVALRLQQVPADRRRAARAGRRRPRRPS